MLRLSKEPQKETYRKELKQTVHDLKYGIESSFRIVLTVSQRNIPQCVLDQYEIIIFSMHHSFILLVK